MPSPNLPGRVLHWVVAEQLSSVPLRDAILLLFAYGATLFFMAGRWCAVTVRDEKGTLHTIEAPARSIFHAASLFIGTAHGKSPGQNLPLPSAETIFEIRLIGEERIYRVLGKRVQQWANEEARKQHDAVHERIDRRNSRRERG